MKQILIGILVVLMLTLSMVSRDAMAAGLTGGSSAGFSHLRESRKDVRDLRKQTRKSASRKQRRKLRREVRKERRQARKERKTRRINSQHKRRAYRRENVSDGLIF